MHFCGFRLVQVPLSYCVMSANVVEEGGNILKLLSCLFVFIFKFIYYTHLHC